MKPFLGTCYYPEHWPESQWPDDAKRMAELGLSVVRIGEFCWSRLEPQPGVLNWQWMDQAIETLASQGLQVVIGTPTATPPRWMLDKHPGMLAVDEDARPRKFGSRRHYCFSHQGYLAESIRIAKLMAQRYAEHPALHSWQIDNEYGCHDTVVSYSEAARQAFIQWLELKYQSIDELNRAWGNVFWSMEYATFAQVDLPNLTVTEANPAHCLDFKRFSSDQVVRYNQAQVAAIREFSNAPLIHNYMGRITDFDHFKVGEDLDIASWDSYPLGFLLDRSGASEQWQQRFARQGDPDFQAFHHDLYRAVGRGRWWVMEQQPGPVNWAPNNPAPLPGMVRLWSWEAIAHQAEAVCYFRWRQAPFAQEQMHAGLLRPDSENSATFSEVQQFSNELAELGEIQPARAEVALIFDYESCWAWQTQPQGEQFDYFALSLDFYRGLRRLGVSVDIVSPHNTDLQPYSLVVVAGLMHWPPDFLEQLHNHPGQVLLGPRSGSKTKHFSIPTELPPGIAGLDCKVCYVETLSRGSERELAKGGFVHTWVESLESAAQVVEQTTEGAVIQVRQGNIDYLGAWPDDSAMQRIMADTCQRAGVSCVALPEGVRRRRTGSHEFYFNHNAHAVEVDGETIAAADLRYKSLD